MRSCIRISAVSLGLLAVRAILAAAATQTVTPTLDGFDVFVAQAMQSFKVPGVAIAVVQNGRIILAKGYGHRDVDKQLPITSRTLFPIASITKSFTVTTLGTLVDDGKLDWDKPVRNYLPGFRMYDPVATDELTPRDLVTHRSGLPRHDLLWYSSNFTRKQLVERLRYLEPNKPIRMTFQYNNLMFITAGYLAGELNDTSWEDAVRQRVLTPLGMTNTMFSSQEAQKSSDFAQPYRKNRKTEEVRKIAFADWGDVGPAGAINSNLDDLSRYLVFHMNKGTVDGKQILSRNNAEQMQTPQMVIQGIPDYKELGEGSYGMGLFISTYRGHKFVEHGGNLDGFSLELAFLPQDQIGVVVLTNLDGTPVRDLLAYNVFDRLLGLEQAPWIQRFLDREKKFKEAESTAEQKGFTGEKPNTHPSHDLKDYAGEFSHPAYGLVTIAMADGFGGDLKLTLNRLTRPVHHFHYDTFAVPADPLDPMEKMKVSFITDLNGDISSLSMPLESNVKPIVFERVAERRMFERSFIEPFTGNYDLFGTTLSVTLKGENTLVMSEPGSPVLKLIPKHGTTFDVESHPGETIEFKQDTSGKITEAVLYTTESAYVIKRK